MRYLIFFHNAGHGGDEEIVDILTFRVRRSPITAANFLPPSLPLPRAWERVPVELAACQGRQRKIWKRVAGAAPTIRDAIYYEVAAELDSQGAGPRKRARMQSYVSPWGDIAWAADSESPHDGHNDLVEARGRDIV